jgi:hypothetical protein
MKLKIYYRISDKGTNAGKPSYINWENCLINFLKHFEKEDIKIIADNVEEDTHQGLNQYFNREQITRTNLGNGNGFLFTLKLAIKECNEDEFIYFVEDDYFHRTNSKKVLLEGLERADYVSLYDHKDKYLNPSPNPFVKNGGEVTKVILTKSTHWKYTNSTCMTFASNIKALKEDKDIFIKYCQNKRIPDDFDLFIELLKTKNRKLITPIPGYSTHGMNDLLSPLIDWEKEL